LDFITVTVDDKRNIELLPSTANMPEHPLVILAHGAGNNMRSYFMEFIAEQLEKDKVNVLRFNFPYKVSGKKIPDKQIVLERAWLSTIHWAENNLTYTGLFVGGKSLGARIASIVSDRVPKLLGLIFLGYPLHPPGKPENLRDAHLYDLELPMLFLQGSRDPFARLDLLKNVVKKLEPYPHLHLLEQADHSFKIPKKLGRTYEEILEEAADVTTKWILKIQGNK
jgi:predicted alpha/beta-hydrolase family hydrolase